MCTNCSGPVLTRRTFLGAGALAAAAAVLSPPFVSRAAAQAGTTLSPDEALRRLEEGNARYAANISTNKDYSVARATQAKGQTPFAAVLSCSDSRVAPELLFDQGPGELFVVRVAGNFVNDEGLASLEYGAFVLGIPLIVVLGHTSCGAVEATIKALAGGPVLPGNLSSLVNALMPSVQAAEARKPADLLAEATVENVRHNAAYLNGSWPILSERVAAGKLRVVGGVYDITAGNVTLI